MEVGGGRNPLVSAIFYHGAGVLLPQAQVGISGSCCDQLWIFCFTSEWTSGSTGGPVGNFSPKIRYLSRLTSEALVGFCILSLIKQLRQGKLTMARST